MMRILLGLVILLGVTGLVLAEETKLSAGQIAAALSDKTLHGEGEIEQIFQKGGMTIYTADGNVSQGLWKVDGDAYCSQWPPNETWSCYDVMQDGSKITFVSKSGKRYEMQTAP